MYICYFLITVLSYMQFGIWYLIIFVIIFRYIENPLPLHFQTEAHFRIRDHGVDIVNLTEIPVTYGYVAYMDEW